MFKAELSNGVMYEFNSFKALYYRALGELKYVVSRHKTFDTESAMLFANGKFICFLYVSTTTICIRAFNELNNICIVNMRGDYTDEIPY